MVVSVKFHGVQRRVVRKDQIHVPIFRNARVTDVIEYLGERYPELQLNRSGVLVSVNDRISPLDHVLESDDRISLIPPIGGG
ncbi:MAG: MoaD/ThiS family protein [Deltaproteobacteria bacterium]|nr:MoaD/ThiS family protein [Deltaproteobacteria bacterium]